MKAKGLKFYGCLLVVFAIGLAVSIGMSIGNAKTLLSDDAMSSVYGGCGPCDNMYTQGCIHTKESSCTDEDCDGWYREGCPEDRKECKNTQPGTQCTPTTKNCEGSYTLYDCEYGGYGTCQKVNGKTKSCSSYEKAWCEVSE
jgi:hypothetical protein